MSPLRLITLIAGAVLLRLGAYALVSGGLGHMCQWDCGWYNGIVAQGYNTAPLASGPEYSRANWAFFPLWPLLVWAGTQTGLTAETAGLVLANIFFAAALVVGVFYLAKRTATPPDLGLAAFILCFPYSLYFSVPYTESLFALLALGALYTLTTNRRALACALTGLLAATRVTGILLFPVLVWCYSNPAWTAWRTGQRKAAVALLADAILPLSLAPLGLALFSAYLHAHTGDGLAFSHIESAWQRDIEFPPLVLAHGLLQWDFPQFLAFKSQSASFSALCGLATFGLSLYLARRGLWAEAVFLLLSVLLASAAGLTSLQRYTLANPVTLVFLYDALRRSPLRPALPWLCAAGAALQLYFVHLWSLHYGAFI